jgi:hypothetical protein
MRQETAMRVPITKDTSPERRLMQRRGQPDRRLRLRWYPHGGDRRHKPGRRRDDTWETMKAVLANILPTQDKKRQGQ